MKDGFVGPHVKVQTGVEGLDEMLAGGLLPGRPYLVVGPLGCGKTTLALQFLLRGVRLGENVLYVTLEEPPNEIKQNFRRLPKDLDKVWIFDAIPDVMRYEKAPFKDIAAVREAKRLGDITTEIRKTDEFRSVEIAFSALMQTLKMETVKRFYSRVVVDSLTALEYFCMKGFDDVQGAQVFLRFLSELKITTLLTVETPPSDLPLPERMLARGEIHLFSWEADRRTIRAIGIEKFRGSPHDQRLHPYRIASHGIAIDTSVSISKETREIRPVPPSQESFMPKPTESELALEAEWALLTLLDDVKELLERGVDPGVVRELVQKAHSSLSSMHIQETFQYLLEARELVNHLILVHQVSEERPDKGVSLPSLVHVMTEGQELPAAEALKPRLQGDAGAYMQPLLQRLAAMLETPGGKRIAENIPAALFNRAMTKTEVPGSAPTAGTEPRKVPPAAPPPAPVTPKEAPTVKAPAPQAPRPPLQHGPESKPPTVTTSPSPPMVPRQADNVPVKVTPVATPPPSPSPTREPERDVAARPQVPATPPVKAPPVGAPPVKAPPVGTPPAGVSPAKAPPMSAPPPRVPPVATPPAGAPPPKAPPAVAPPVRAPATPPVSPPTAPPMTVPPVRVVERPATPPTAPHPATLPPRDAVPPKVEPIPPAPPPRDTIERIAAGPNTGPARPAIKVIERPPTPVAAPSPAPGEVTREPAPTQPAPPAVPVESKPPPPPPPQPTLPPTALPPTPKEAEVPKVGVPESPPAPVTTAAEQAREAPLPPPPSLEQIGKAFPESSLLPPDTAAPPKKGKRVPRKSAAAPGAAKPKRTARPKKTLDDATAAQKGGAAPGSETGPGEAKPKAKRPSTRRKAKDATGEAASEKKDVKPEDGGEPHATG
jgi:KaiC/GvpD/RAD55 family RecA-like ATPase